MLKTAPTYLQYQEKLNNLKNTIMRIIIIIITLFLPFICLAQTLRGVVIDADTNEPIAGASVYLNGTTLGCNTDSEGHYSIKVNDIIYTQLVLSFMGYETVIIENPFELLPDTVYLKEKGFRVNEVTVKGRPTFSERQKMQAFREQFLGVTPGGRACRILNEKDIRLVYDPKEHKLHGYTDVPIVVKNTHLGYHVKCELIQFTLILGPQKSLHSKNTDTAQTIITASFEELPKINNFHHERRKDTYKYSKNRFFKLISKSDLINSELVILKDLQDKNLQTLLKQEQFFNVMKKKADESTINIEVVPESKNIDGITSFVITESSENNTNNFENTMLNTVNIGKRYYGYKHVIYTHASTLFINADSFNVDSYGNTDLFFRLFITGDMSRFRVGDQLPLDYLSDPTSIYH